MHRKLKCSFCGKDETEIEKLVAVGKKDLIRASVLICNKCVSIAHDIMLVPQPPRRGPPSPQHLRTEDQDSAGVPTRRSAAQESVSKA